MRLEDLFSVPAGQKVTERHLRRVLASSICSILLCMSCLAGSTWGWFTVSIENRDNVIQIGKPEVIVTKGDEKLNSGYTLEDGTHTVRIDHGNEEDDLQKKSTLYVTLTIQVGNETKFVYVTLDNDNNYTTEVTVICNQDCTLSWEASWFAPDGADELVGDTKVVTVEEPTEPPTEEPTEASTETEPSTETGAPTEDTTEESEPTETETLTETEAPTEISTETEAETT